MKAVKEYIVIVYPSSKIIGFDDYEEYGHDDDVAVHRVCESRNKA